MPAGARAAARVLVVSERERVLLLEASDGVSGERWWVAPGGGLRPHETFEAAALRELEEETGLLLEIGPWVWTRRHIFTFEGRRHDQYERYFVVTTTEHPVLPRKADSYVVGYRWWSLPELRMSDEVFAPRALARLLPPILRGAYPWQAIDCGV